MPGNSSPTGRERAIEALIDREPNGSFYRAARVVDEAVPVALGSRPNLATKAALVEQAFALSVHDVDNIAKYDQLYLEERKDQKPASASAKVDALSKERIFHYQAKIVAAKEAQALKTDGTSTPPHVRKAIPVSPPPSLVAALRSIFEEPSTSTDSPAVAKLKVETSNALFELRQFLEAVSSHSVFQATGATEELTASSQANLEKLILNVAKKATDQSENSEAALQGLLIAVLSVLTSQQQQKKQPLVVVKVNPEEAKTAASEEPDDQDDLPSRSALQVGALLSLFPLDTLASSSASAAVEDESAIRSTSGLLDPALLEYFGEAAAVYEERLEIQKARMLARLQTATTSERSSTPPVSSSQPENQDHKQGDGTSSAAETPTAGADSDNVGEVPGAAVTDDEAERRDASQEDVSPGSDNGDEGNVSHDESSDSRGEEEDNGENEDKDNMPDDSNSEGMGEDVASGDDEDEQFHTDEEDDDIVNENEDGSSSSSSSSDSSFDEDADMMESDVDALDTDEEDEAVLRQALAMSMAEHEADSAAENAEDAAVALESSTDGIVVASASEAQGEGEENSVPGSQDEMPENSAAETPVSRSTEDRHSVSSQGCKEEEDESNLPSLPQPPPALLLSSRGVGSTAPISDDPDARTMDKASDLLLNPSELSHFGSISVSRVLFHLLQYTATAVERRLFDCCNTLDETTVVAGGMCCSLFAPESLGDESRVASPPSIDSTEELKRDFTLQLLVASFLLVVEKRNDAIASLHEAVVREQRAAQGDEFNSEDDDAAEDESSAAPPLSSGEEDDPALSLALNYVEDDCPLSSDSLENKGMRRKAAAAAHDAAALLKSLRKRTDAWKDEVKLYSICLVNSMNLLRRFLQSLLRQSLMDSASGTDGLFPVSAIHAYLPSFVAVKLSESLDSLTAVSAHSSHLAMLGGEHSEVERVFRSLDLYREALHLWGECVPLLHPSESSRSDHLRMLLRSSSVDAMSDRASSICSIDELRAFPPSNQNTLVYRLEILCRRLRVSDLLDGFVSRPIPCVSDDFGEDDDSLSMSISNRKLSDKPHFSSSLISFLGGSLNKLPGGREEAGRLYLALCHRCNNRILLLDGFYATTETEADDPTAPSPGSKTLSSGDTVRVGASPSNLLQFDVTKCSDSIAVLSGFGGSSDSTTGIGSCVNQRASKVWGAVLSTHHYSPKTGVHRWAVRLDKCERGHVFIGVATAQASTRTYVGGDKYGWGMIGTQALWHDRRKIRGDYGATFRTGSTIIVTLDTDAGTLSYSSWKDNSASSSFSLDPLVQNLLTPKRSGQIAGTVEDWGIAFEGLPLDARLYPAVGLYQRDDRVTLLPVESSGLACTRSGIADISGGECYFPRGLEGSDLIRHVRQFNDLLSWDGVRYAAETLQHVVVALEKDSTDDFVLRNVLPSLAAAICLLPPSVPMLSTRFAISLMPHLSRCILELGRLLLKGRRHRFFQSGLRAGKWIIRATGTSGSSTEVEEYVVDFTEMKEEGRSAIFIEGRGIGTTGKSKNGLVTIFGSMQGSSLNFVEEWSDGKEREPGLVSEADFSSCVVTARMSTDGRRFDGSYRNVHYGSSGQIAGVLQTQMSMNKNNLLKEAEAPMLTNTDDLTASIEMCEALLCLAQSHLSNLLGDDAAGDLDQEVTEPTSEVLTKELVTKRDSLKGLLMRPLLSGASLGPNMFSLDGELGFLEQLYAPPLPTDELCGIRRDHLLAKVVELEETLPPTKQKALTVSPQLVDHIAVIDDVLARESGGFGSLRSLCPSKYTETRRQVICALVQHCGIAKSVTACTDPDDFDSEERDHLRLVWRTALKIMEDSVRGSLSRFPGENRRERCSKVCDLRSLMSTFLLSLERDKESAFYLSIEDALAELSIFFEVIDDKSDLEFLKLEMSLASKRGILRLIALDEIGGLLLSIGVDGMVPLESLVVGLPRLLGRGKVELGSTWKAVLDDDQVVDAVPDLDGSYLANLSGSSLKIRGALRKKVGILFQNLGQAADKAICQRNQNISSPDFVASSDSFMLAVLAVFVGNVRREDRDSIISGSGLFAILSQVLSTHRSALLCDPLDTIKPDEDSIASKNLQAICQRDISRAILRCAVAVAHVVTFQMTNNHEGCGGKVRCHGDSLNLLLTELAVIFPLIEDSALSALSDLVAHRSDEEWNRWNDVIGSVKTSTCSNDKLGEGKMARRGSSGLEFLRYHGTMLNPALQGNAQKQAVYAKGSPGGPSRMGTTSLTKASGGFSSQFLSHWLHVLCAVLRSQSSLSVIAKDRRWLTVLFKAVGLAVDLGNDGTVCDVSLRQHENGILPARFRARILRLILPLLAVSDPNNAIVEGLFHLAGVSSTLVTQSLDDEESFVSRESVSLLRHLHLPIYPRWRECVNQTLAEITSNTENSSFQCKKVGVLSFFSGSLETIGSGSFVLLKPAASAAISADFQPSPGSKPHPNGIGGSAVSAPIIGATPHHITGNGTEGVMAGLCRDDASAGIVSNIDLKNNICEVILVARNEKESNKRKNTVDAKRASPGKAAAVGRHMLTVRALRTPLSDVVHAQEVPLFLDGSIPTEKITGTLLQSSLVSLLSATMQKHENAELSGASLDELKSKLDEEVRSNIDREHKEIDISGKSETTREEGEGEKEGGSVKREDPKSLRSDVLGLSVDLMTLRCCIVILSDERILSSFYDNEAGKESLTKILTLAWPDDSEAGANAGLIRAVRNKGLSSLPIHEARFGHLISLLRDINFRMQIAKQSSPEQQERRCEMLRPSQEQNSTETSSTTNAEASVGQSESTPRCSTSRGDATEALRDTNNSSRSNFQSTEGNNSEDEEEAEAAVTAAAHLREAAIAQMAELGLPRSWSELALRRTGGVNIEAAVTFCLEHGGEIERLLAEERERDHLMRGDTAGASSRRRGDRDSGPTNHLLRQLLEMGFPQRWCTEALAVTGNNVDEALTWILSNGERLSEEDERNSVEAEEGERDDGDEDDSMDEDEEDETEVGDTADEGEGEVGETSQHRESRTDSARIVSMEERQLGWWGSVTPLRFISGRAIVDPIRMEISGLPSGGFSSVGTKGILLTSGKWYYEAVLKSAGCLQIGWADGSFAGHCHADRGDGCGDGPSSWAFDGWRRYRWHATSTEWGCRWKEGDVVGCLVDMEEHIVSFTLNGQGEAIGMGVAFTGEGFRPCGGVYACVSFNRKEKVRLILGGSGSEAFRHSPPPGYRGVGEAVLEAVQEMDRMLLKEQILDSGSESGENSPKKFLCDFSDEEHGHELMAWAHRYYGSDASVHLGSARSKHGTSKPASNTSPSEMEGAACVSRRVEKIWAEQARLEPLGNDINYEHVAARLYSGYEEAQKRIVLELFNECVVIAMILSRKLMMHIVVTEGACFDPGSLISDEKDRVTRMLQFWKVIEACTSLRNAGWVGEAGAMAIAAEALGLGISSNDQMQSRAAQERLGVTCANDLDDGLFLPTGGITQVLTSVLTVRVEESNAVATSFLAPSSAEAAMGSAGGGGLLAFLQEGLQSAVVRSQELRRIILAAIRRSSRLLAVVEYDGDDFYTPEHEEKIHNDSAVTTTSPSGRSKYDLTEECSHLPDARLTAFFSGLLLSKPVMATLEDGRKLQEDLFEAWSIGLLSASLPWRMVCAFTAAGILNQNPKVLSGALNSSVTLARYFGRLQSTVARRLWAERAAFPVCSRYAQALIELVTSVQRSVPVADDLPTEFNRFWGKIQVDAAVPLPLNSSVEKPLTQQGHFWESEEGWISSDSAWEVWTGTVEYLPVDWKTPLRSSVRMLMDGGEGPPMLREGCLVVRGVDWNREGTGSANGNDDGKNIYDAEKAERDREKKRAEEEEKEDQKSQHPDLRSKAEGGKEADPDHSDPAEENGSENPAEPGDLSNKESSPPAPITEEGAEDIAGSKVDENSKKKKKKKKTPGPKLPLGTVLSVEPWNGIPGMARRVRWNLTGIEGVYRYGGDGGRYDLCHIEANSRGTRIKKRHPVPESSEQCASRHGFGARKTYSVLLRLRKHGEKEVVGNKVEYHHEGILEWPDFGAGVRVKCTRYDSILKIEETQLLFGSKDSGWETRFGQPSFVPGSVTILSMTEMSSPDHQNDFDIRSPSSSLYEELQGKSSFDIATLRNPADGGKLKVASKMRLYRSRHTKGPPGIPTQYLVQAPMPPPLTFDRECHASSLSISRDGRTVSCVTPERGTAFASIGFTKGVHYWEVKLEQADIGSVFIGVAEKPSGSGSASSYSHDAPVRLNRWHGWGFVNFRATYTSGAERVYGSHCHSGDTVGVLLDCDAGRVSFFFDGLKYGEHILNDLGCAFENISPFGFNVNGCGSGGAGQGAPSGFESTGRYPQGTNRPRTLWPVIGLRTHGDRISLSPKWSTSYGVDGVVSLRNVLAVDELLSTYSGAQESAGACIAFPQWFIEEAFSEYRRWKEEVRTRAVTRGSGPFRLAGFGLDVDFDASPMACAAASASLGLQTALLAGDRVKLKRSAGRILELAEEAVVLGAYQGRLYYKIVSQKSEGGSLAEGGGRAWCWDESEVVDGLTFVSPSRGLGVALPKLARFSCSSSGGLRVIYDNGAVLRSDLEIFDGSMRLGTIPVNTILPKSDVLDRRVNSCGLVRFRVRYEEFGEGWISARIRGDTEEPIVEPVTATEETTEDEDPFFQTPAECATAWYEVWQKALPEASSEISKGLQQLQIENVESFNHLLSEGVIPGLTTVASDCVLTSAVNAISNYCDGGDALECPFGQVASSLSFALASEGAGDKFQVGSSNNAAANQATATVFFDFKDLPPLKAALARIAVLRSLNRRARLALPWLSMRPCQEGSAILGGMSGHGTSPDRAGRARVADPDEIWVQLPSVATRIRSLRGIFFTSVKHDYFVSITEATTTPTSLSHDEYELPREIRTVRINRLKAGRAMMSDDASAKRKYSVFAQLHSETKNWGGAALRRGYVAKGHGGQKRAFKVKLIGEGVNDYSGPYREAFTDAIGEILQSEADGRGALGVLDPSPNNASSIGENRDLFMFSLNGRQLHTLKKVKSDRVLTAAEDRIQRTFASLMAARDETSREVEEALVFLGRIVGTAFRHGIPLDLPLPLASVWKALTEESVSSSEKLNELDYLAYRQLEHEDKEADKSPLLWWQQRMLNSFAEGLGNVLPVEILPLLTGEELRDMFCGNADVDVELLRQVVEYEGYEESAKVIGYFWETLHGMSNDERKQFLQFVWARNRLPLRKSDFDAPFKIQKDSVNTGDRADQALPSASTCFFSLTLPEYSSQEILSEKLLFAINNVTTMETDFQTNSAEIAEGYRAF